MLDKNNLFRLFAERDAYFKISPIGRDGEREAVRLLEYKEILAITGVRRCGKTYMLYFLMQHLLKKGIPQENVLYLNFEDERLAFIEPDDFEKIYEWYLEFSHARGKLYFFLDEVQNAPLWEKWLSRSFEKIKFIISGSNSNLLASELASALTGRHVELSIYPFSFNEYITHVLKKHFTLHDTYRTETRAAIARHFKEYTTRGGFPESLLYGKTDLLQTYYQNIVLHDVIARYSIKHRDSLEKLALYLLSNIARPTSLYALQKIIPLGINTIKNYQSYLEKSFLLFLVSKFDHSLKKQMMNAKKVYAIDTALASAVNFASSADTGRMLENLISIELKRRKHDIFTHKGKHECDFVLKKSARIHAALQVTAQLTEENRKRETRGLSEAMAEHSLKAGTIITLDQEEQDGNITIVPAWKWLLRPEV